MSVDKAPILICNLKEKVSMVLECNAVFTKAANFKKLNGAPAKHGASKTNA